MCPAPSIYYDMRCPAYNCIRLSDLNLPKKDAGKDATEKNYSESTSTEKTPPQSDKETELIEDDAHSDDSKSGFIEDDAHSTSSGDIPELNDDKASENEKERGESRTASESDNGGGQKSAANKEREKGGREKETNGQPDSNEKQQSSLDNETVQNESTEEASEEELEPTLKMIGTSTRWSCGDGRYCTLTFLRKEHGAYDYNCTTEREMCDLNCARVSL